MSTARIERATCRLGGDRSIQLSYEDVVLSRLAPLWLFLQFLSL